MKSHLNGFMLQGDGRLCTPIVALLQHAFQFDVHALQKTRWIKYDQTTAGRLWAKLTGIPRKTRAAVMGNLVIHDGATDRSAQDWFRLLVHEQVHICQIAQQGFVPFYFRYLLEAAGKSYQNISFEKEAFRYGADRYGNDLALKLWQFRQHAVEKVLTDDGLSDEQKSRKLAELGQQFCNEMNAK